MLKLPAIVVVALILGSSAFAAPVLVTVQVTLTNYNGDSDTYQAQVRVIANPCPDETIDTTTIVAARNADEARDKMKGNVAKITKDANEEAAHCGAH